MIDQLTIDKVLDATNIVDVVGEYVELKRKGTNYVGVCPFHTDKNPSMYVSPAKGIFKCFSCGTGGGAVQFIEKHLGLDFPAAIKLLAEKVGIQITEVEPSDEERQNAVIREAMFLANEKMVKVYAEELKKNSAALQYARKRWGEEFCKSMDIGFCPPYSRLVEQSDITDEVAGKLHLKSEKGYDVFSGRIIIPIRNRSQRVIGFTARILAKDSNSPKYLNSSDSLIYNKSTSIFGINTAWNEACKSDRFYLVEGAPDCMRLQSIGVFNTVAPLGTAWTNEHFAQLKKAASHLCFLPDSDPPKPNEEFGPGIHAVIKSGKEAIMKGFSVSVKQLPQEAEKQDPDTYCTSKNIFNAIEETDYIDWYAEKIFKEGMTTVQKSRAVASVAEILAFIKDDTALEMYVSKLVRFTTNKSTWRKAIDQKRKELQAKKAKEKEAKEESLFKKYGFNVGHNYYYSYGDKDNFEWSNFVMEPVYHIMDPISPKRYYKLLNRAGVERFVEMKPEEMVSLTRFKQKLDSVGNFLWFAGEKEMDKLKQYLYEKTTSAFEIKKLGWQRDGFFAYGNGIFYENHFIPVNEKGIVELDESHIYYLPAFSTLYKDEMTLYQFERKFAHLGLSKVSMKEVTGQFFKVYGDNGKVGFCFLLAALFRDVVLMDAEGFPLLDCFGQPSTGKTHLALMLMSFFIVNYKAPTLSNATPSSVSSFVSDAANALVFFDEYKNDIDPQLMSALKGIWDGSGRTRMNMDRDKKKETMTVDSSVIICGQELPNQDIALFTRLVYLEFQKSDFTLEEKFEYQKLKTLYTPGLSHLTLQILQQRSTVERFFHNAYLQTSEEVSRAVADKQIVDRIIGNWIIPLAMFRTLENWLDVPLSYKEMFDITVKGILQQNKLCALNDDTAKFWKCVQYLISDGELIDGGDYKIRYENEVSTSIQTYQWKEARPVLYLQKTKVFTLYKKHEHNLGESFLSEGSLRNYLQNSKAYLGEKTIRYRLFYKGVPQMEYSNKTTVPPTQKSVTQRSLCFDYRLLKSRYEINFEKVSTINNSPEGTTPAAEEEQSLSLDFSDPQ